ncbi:hypothetical protein D3C72_2423150 [compost metagenome]
MAELFLADPRYAEILFAEVRQDGDVAELAILLRQLDRKGDKDGSAPVVKGYP